MRIPNFRCHLFIVGFIVFVSCICGCVALDELISDYNIAMNDPVLSEQVKNVSNVIDDGFVTIAPLFPSMAPWVKTVVVSLGFVVSSIFAVWCGARKRKGGA